MPRTAYMPVFVMEDGTRLLLTDPAMIGLTVLGAREFALEHVEELTRYEVEFKNEVMEIPGTGKIGEHAHGVLGDMLHILLGAPLGVVILSGPGYDRAIENGHKCTGNMPIANLPEE